MPNAGEAEPKGHDGHKPTLSRSPHPYQRQQASFTQARDFGNRNVHATHFSTSNRGRRWKEHSSSSDSGTEADDENGAFLRALPPAPLPSQKGLKIPVKGLQGRTSPLLTPSILDEDHRQKEWEKQHGAGTSLPSPALSDDKKTKIQAKFEAKRQAELLRRFVETLLLAGVGAVAVQPVLNSDEHRLLTTELLVWMATSLCLYCLYPLQLINRRRIEKTRGTRLLPWLRVSASFEPAPFLYPVLVPVLVSLAMKSPRINTVVSLMLSLSSIPRSIIPLATWSPCENSLQWMLSLLPLVTSFHSLGLSHTGPSSNRILIEKLSLVFLLHEKLLAVLYYLTTTSLLTAELQLSSAILIQLLISSVTPQTAILKAVFWIGGTILFSLTWRVLRWEVALARIPIWRFRKPSFRTRRNHILGSAFNDLCRGRLSRILSASDDIHASYNDMGNATNTTPREDRFSHSKELRSKADSGSWDEHLHSDDDTTISTHKIKASQRRNTMPSRLEIPKDLAIDLISPFAARTRSLNRTFLHLTQTQGSIVRWLIAFYTYFVVALIILLPIRFYVSHYALANHEPFGWAVGYLLGDLPLLRQAVGQWDLHSWIPVGTAHADIPALISLRLDDLLEIIGTPSPTVRLCICVWCLLVILAGLALVFSLSPVVDVDTRRKVFHGMMVAMFLPTIFIDPLFVSFAFSLMLPIFLLLDLFRASQLPPLSKPLTHFLAPYVDGRDHRGPVIVSHIFLLIGCAIPLWLSLAGIGRIGNGPWSGWVVSTRDLSMVSGVICVGMGDAAASLVGRRFGRRRWCWTGGKSFEGSFAFFTAVVLGLCLGRTWLRVGGWAGDSGDLWVVTVAKASVAGAGASLTEAVLTGGNDNVIVPVILWLLVKGLGI